MLFFFIRACVNQSNKNNKKCNSLLKISYISLFKNNYVLHKDVLGKKQYMLSFKNLVMATEQDFLDSQCTSPIQQTKRKESYASKIKLLH